CPVDKLLELTTIFVVDLCTCTVMHNRYLVVYSSTKQ
ncbi:MAG: hypothetical protein ACI9YO_003092, partial [Gammaproteobacteria bacterium]